MPRDIKRRDVLKGAGVAGLAGLAGCSSLGGGGGGSTLMQGVLMPETGDLASVGKPIRDGALLPAVQLEGETEFTIDTQVGDTQTNPQAGISAANNLVNAGYPSITGPASSGVNLQVSRQVFIPNKVVGCSPSSTSPNVTTLEDNDYIFRTPPSDALQGRVIAQVATERENAQTASTMYVNNDYGQALSDAFESAFSGEVQATVSFEKEQASYTTRLESALADDPDALVVIGYPASGIQIFRDYYSEFDTGASIIVTDGLKDPTLPEEVGNSMSNVIGTAPTAAGPGVKFFTNLWKDEYGGEPGVFTSQAYDATAVCLLANAAAGATNDGTDVRDNLRKVANPGGEAFGPAKLPEAIEAAAAGDDIAYQGASSSVDFDENGDMKAVTYEVFSFSSEGVSTETTIEFSG
ncbi:ABC transporter substrate-binding protein [Natronomonas sp. EA1]|uniref:ABC transporter substrate-binding protein n=1 Tax=Natronomonas sp. EA1 TaxID=3421655 RepID=UPI003EBECDCA